MVLSQVILQSLLILFPVVPIIYLIHRRMDRLRNEKRDPFKNSAFQRHPGQSTLEKIHELEAKFTEEAVYLTLIPVLLAIIYFFTWENYEDFWPAYVFLIAVSLTGCIILGKKVLKTIDLIRNYQLGFKGELYVAQQLEPLIRKGYFVFHDLVFENFNIDHVIVGSTGVFAVETKAKRKNNEDSKGHELTYDGSKLTFSDHTFDTKAVEQAKGNAEILGKLIKSKTEESIPVYPILTFPGWNVKRIGKGTVNVVNPKELSRSLSFFPNGNLSPEQVRFVTMALAQHRPNS